jgi:DNA-binding NarL/FixJ family response regulator
MRSNKPTKRERQVAGLVALGHSSKVIAQMFRCSEKNIKSHRCNLMGKLGLHNAAQLTEWALNYREPSAGHE